MILLDAATGAVISHRPVQATALSEAGGQLFDGVRQPRAVRDEDGLGCGVVLGLR